MRSKIGGKARLKHILDAILEIEGYLLNVDFQLFLKNSMMRFACIKQMEIIVRQVIISLKKQRQNSTSIEWKQMCMRNVFVYEYFGGIIV
ncbi:MAG: DUF86 domain-containing protein [Bacteroidetes bacterium]|nr:DUF86 domain-containing protein [Bacteroidota bacterium]